MSSNTVPTTTSLSDIYTATSLPTQQKRWTALLSAFKKEYNTDAAFVSRSPGRVNLLGEHIDYSQYAVLPMAVEVDVLLAVGINEKSSKVRIANIDGEKFPAREIEIPQDREELEIDAKAHEWSNYFKAGLKGVLGSLRKNGKTEAPVGMDIMVHGTVPSGGGLSSSAAFVCAAGLAVLKANGVEAVDKKELVEVAMVSERAVGVNSGGMDQSASVFGQQGSALYVSFKPTLTAQPISFPTTKPETAILIAQSFVAADKHVTAPIHYNLRVVECSLAAAFMARAFGLKKPLPKDASPLGISLRGFHDTFFEERRGVEDNTKTSDEEFIKQLEELIRMVEDYLPQEQGYSREEIRDMLGIDEGEFKERFESSFPVRAERFKLRQRALHVFEEAWRVFKFKELLATTPNDDEPSKESETTASEAPATAATPAAPTSASLLKDLGDIMNTTQSSCRTNYDCSCPELDDLCALARSAGSYGSRLTGAGWGGCSVHLVPVDKIEAVKKAWTDKYYKKRFPDLSDEKLEEAIVVSGPSSGAFVYVVRDGKVQ